MRTISAQPKSIKWLQQSPSCHYNLLEDVSPGDGGSFERCRHLKMVIRALPPLARWRRTVSHRNTKNGAGRRYTVCRLSYETTPVGDATAEVDAALVASSLRTGRRLKGGGGVCVDDG